MGYDWAIMIFKHTLIILADVRIGFLLGIIGSVIGFNIIFYCYNSIPIIIMYLSFSILNYINYKKWKQIN